MVPTFGGEKQAQKQLFAVRFSLKPARQPSPYRRSAQSGLPHLLTIWRAMNSTFAGRSANRRMKYGYHSVPNGIYTRKP